MSDLQNTNFSVEVSVVIPLYNEAEIIPELIERTVKSCQDLHTSFECILINDGSTDRTLEVLVQYSSQLPQIKILNLFRNFGHMSALSAGLAVAKGQAIVLMDGDLQDPPELIVKFFQKWKEGFDVVLGHRSKRKEHYLKRIATQCFYSLLKKLEEIEIPTQVGTFSLMDKKVVEILNQIPEKSRFFSGLRAWVGGKKAIVEYERENRKKGKSRVGILGLFRLAQTALISFSKAPLRLASGISLLCGFALFLIGIIAALVRIFTDLAIPGWATYTTLIGLMGFVQSMALFIIAEYIAVIFDEVKGRPLFLIREIYENGVMFTTSKTLKNE